MKYIITLVCFLTTAFAHADSRTSADSAYTAEKYAEAVELYETILKDGDDAAAFYNLGNSYFRLRQYPLAILNYERAARYIPTDKDVRHNLAIANSRLTERISPMQRMFFVTMYHDAKNALSISGWTHTALAAFTIALLSLLIYLLSSRIGIRKLAFSISCLSLFVVIMANIFAYSLHKDFVNRNYAIVSSSATLQSSPTTSEEGLGTVPPGIKVRITDKGISGWYEVTLPDGKTGWIERPNAIII